jgi:hypothetical protein
MARNSKDFTYDHALLMKDAGLIASSAAAQVGGSAKVLDLGAGRVDARVVLQITAVEVASNDEVYDIEVQLSNSATFASGIVISGIARLGALEASFESADTVAGRREIHFANEVDGTLYRYARLFTRVAGQVATGINYSAFAVLGTR